jgi:hypothetical protein
MSWGLCKGVHDVAGFFASRCAATQGSNVEIFAAMSARGREKERLWTLQCAWLTCRLLCFIDNE